MVSADPPIHALTASGAGDIPEDRGAASMKQHHHVIPPEPFTGLSMRPKTVDELHADRAGLCVAARTEQARVGGAAFWQELREQTMSALDNCAEIGAAASPQTERSRMIERIEIHRAIARALQQQR